MEIILTRDHRIFAAEVEEFLAERVERNLPATILVNLEGWGPGIEVVCAAGIDPRTAEITAVAVRTPPWPMVVTGAIGAPEGAALVAAWLQEDPSLNGVSGEPTAAQAIADAWAQQTGGTVKLRHEEAMHVLTEVVPPLRPAAGRLRQATEADRETLVAWDIAFSIEAREAGADDAPARVDRRLAEGHHYVWDDGGAVSMLARTHVIAGTARIGPVYTPPTLRNRGYATSAVAALSQLLLDTGAQRCMLFTDLTNPVSSKIYASLGYNRIAGWEILDFH